MTVIPDNAVAAAAPIGADANAGDAAAATAFRRVTKSVRVRLGPAGTTDSITQIVETGVRIDGRL